MNRVVLLILDGLGLNEQREGNALALADTPCLDALFESKPWTTLRTDGSRVGLPEGQMGNSEVGHLNIGAGRVVEQPLVAISKKLSGEFLASSAAYFNFLSSTSGGAIHLMGLFSPGGVHSHQEHLFLLLNQLKKDFAGDIFLHLITDGRDTGPKSALSEVKNLEAHLSQSYPGVSIASLCGRFYAMDRDKRWERTEQAFKILSEAKGAHFPTASSAIEASYSQGVTDEFIEPVIIRPSPLLENDGIIFWNFREDRMRQIAAALGAKHFDGFARPRGAHTLQKILCFSDYDPELNLAHIFGPHVISNFLGEVVAKAGLRQLRLAETEKYAHVTYFLNGGSEAKLWGEERIMVPSPRDVKTYDQKPQMSAWGVTEELIAAIKSKKFDLIVTNYANCDMVGHTGSLEATVKAVETVDSCLQRILETLKDYPEYVAIVTADHGNCEQMINPLDKTPHTAHTTFPVPLFILKGNGALEPRAGGALCDLAPTILDVMGLDKPQEMTGSSLLVKA
jgi:2,3-bisphosphoglycerate-independent phosphoglycerate mutase